MRKMSLVLLALLLWGMLMPVGAQDDTQALEDILSQFAGPDDPAIAVQITTTEGSWAAAVGSADGRRAATPQDRFRIGSMSKTFVAVAALMLAEDEMIDLDDRAADYLPDEIVENIANLDTVTIRQLLAMRSGIDDYLGTDEFWAEVEADPYYPWTAAEALEYAYDLPALFPPDTEFYYSNTNYLLLQLVLEAASEMPLHELIRTRILDPLGMNDTYTQISEDLPGGFVNGYEDIDGDGEAENVSDVNDGAGLGDGALISTVGDLTIFYTALLQDQTLLSEDAMDELLDFQAAEGEGYSLGLNEWEDEDFGVAWGHSGGVLGFLSIGIYLPDEDVILIVLSARGDIDPAEIAVAVGEAYLEE